MVGINTASVLRWKDDDGAFHLLVPAVPDTVELNVIVGDLRQAGSERPRYGTAEIGQRQNELLEICPNQPEGLRIAWASPRVIVAHALKINSKFKPLRFASVL